MLIELKRKKSMYIYISFSVKNDILSKYESKYIFLAITIKSKHLLGL